MPDLKLFANAGFPFTQFADLSQTTVVLPANPSPGELSLYLQLLGHFGAQTGYPALRITVGGPGTVISRDRDYLVLGAVADQPAFSSLDALLRVSLDTNVLKLKQQTGYQSVLSSIGGAMSHGWATLAGSAETQDFPSTIDAEPEAMIEEIESPSSPDRSIVLIVLKQDSSVDTFVDTFVDRSQSDDIGGSVSLLRDAKFTPYGLDGTTYHVGNISRYAMMRIWLTHYFISLLLFVTALSFWVALWTREWLQHHAEERLKLALPPNTDG
jgi:cellulose synthase (UDP-forming)